jgi:putative PIN family toxin of toxin-antitoxin system
MSGRIVLDTNVYISALFYGGKPRQILKAALDGQFQLLISLSLKAELERVMREKFQSSSSEIDQFIASLSESAEWIAPTQPLRMCIDEPDNRVLECAVEGKADFIVTGDKHLLDLAPIAGVSILTPNAFLARLGPTL